METEQMDPQEAKMDVDLTPKAEPRRNIVPLKCSRPVPREYPTNPNCSRRGIAVIANFLHFFFHDSREGSEVDVNTLRTTFEELQFDVVVWNEGKNMTKSWFMTKLEEVARMDHSKYDCFVLVTMTHGEEGGNLHAYDKYFPVDELWQRFLPNASPTLTGKPKLFFFQACRGDKFSKEAYLDSRIDEDWYTIIGTKYSIPMEADILIAFPTIEGNAALRHPSAGSPFIRCLCSVLDDDRANDEKEHILTLMTTVCQKVAAYNWEDRDPGIIIKQMPFITSSLVSLFYLRKKITSGDQN